MSDNEYDNIPDEFADIQGIDWAALLSANEPAPATSSALNEMPSSSTLQTAIPQLGQHPELRIERLADSPFPESESRSSAYFSDSNNMDSAFLAELDRVEQQILLGRPPLPNAAPSASASQTFVQGGASTARYPDGEDIRTSRHVQNLTATQTRNGKAKASEVPDILALYEDELTCPICCDLLVAAHIGNPCGHTFCGECGWHWHIEKKNKGCPCCRQALDKSVPMIPNIAIDNTVEKHVKALAISGATEWEFEGHKYTEWISRKRLWQQGAKKRETRRRWDSGKPGGPLAPIEVFDPPDDWFDESDIELIPRPIRRARRRPQGTGTTIFDLLF